MQNIKLGIIGHGFMGHEHETMLTQLEGYDVVAIADKDEEQLKDVKDGILRCNSIDELLENPEIEVVIIAINNNQHLDVVKKAAKAGKDIICEKPAAMTRSGFQDNEICL